jgi:predicted nucleic acid-binding protein
VALVVDASCLLCYVDADEPRHEDVTVLMRAERGTLVTTELAVAEADYLILDRLGVDAELAFLADLTEGTFMVDCLDRRELVEARQVVARYRDLRLGLADASLVVLSARYATNRILTLDERAFRAVTPLQGGAFTILPADADRAS